MEPEERFERIEALLHAVAERGNQMEIRFNQRVAQAERRWKERMDRADQRMEKFDRRLEATRKVVEVGMKLLVRNEQEHREMRAAIKDLTKSQQAFLDSLRKRGNGNGRKSN